MTEPFQMITTADALQQMIERLQTEPCMALDTEFVWDRTYYARLGLVQIGLTDGTCYLVDPVALTDLTPLGAVLANPEIIKILHDAPQDLMILRRATGATTHNIFDTRMAAGFAGLPSTLSLANLLVELIGVQLAKAHTRANWIARPLSPEELEYAVDDVRYLPKVMDLIRERAREAGVESWLNEALSALDASALYEEKPLEEIYLKLRISRPLPQKNLAALRALAAWREEEARTADRPRRWLLDDKELALLAALVPQSPEDLSQINKLNPDTAKRNGEEIVSVVQKALALPESEWPAPLFQPSRDSELKKSVDAALKDIATRAEEKKIDPALVCSRKEMAKLLQEGAAAKPEEVAMLQGWRAEFLGDLLAKYIPKGLF
jgi:ribonuclease D